MLEGTRVKRSAEQKALDLVNMTGSEVVELAGGLYAFGKRCEAQVLAKLSERSDQRLGFA